MPRNWLEWVALVVGTLALAVVIGVLAVDELSGGDEPPTLSVELHLDRAYESDVGWIVPATLRNDGDEAAEAVELEAVATVAGTEERSGLSVDYAPADTEVDLSFGFSGRPDGEVEVRVTGFRLP